MSQTLPPGFVLDTVPPQGGAALPPGFVLDGPQAAAPAPAATGPAAPPLYAGAGNDTVQPGAPAPAAPERTWMQAILSKPTQGAIGFREGVANLLGLPVDAANNAPRLANLIPGVSGVGPISERPFGGSNQLNDLFAAPVRGAQGALGLPQQDPAPQDMGDRFARRMGQETGSAAVPVAGVLGKAANMTVQAAREAGPVAKFLGVEKAAVNPGKYVADEATMAAAAGAGGSAAGELTNAAGLDPNSNTARVADFLGSILGVGTTAAVKSLAGPVGNVFGAATGNTNFADGVVRDNVVDTILNASGAKAPVRGGAVNADELVAAIRDGQRVGDNIPGFLESTADRTKNPGLAALEYSRQSSPTAAGEFTTRRGNNAQAVDSAMTAVEPQGSPGSLSSAAEARRADRIAEAADTSLQARGDLERASAGLQPRMTADARGADLRAAIEDAYAKVKEGVDAKWAPINESKAPVDVTPLADSIDKGVSNLSVAEQRRFVPGEASIPRELAPEAPAAPKPTGLLDASGDPIMRQAPAPDGKVPLNEVTGMRSALTDTAREAASAGRTNEARVVNRELVDRVDAYLEANLPPELKAQYDAARAATKDMKDRFGRPDTYLAQVLERREGVPRVPDSGVASRFVQPNEGRLQEFQALAREAGNDPRAANAIRDQMLADIKDRGILNSPDAVREYIDQYRTVVDSVPGLRRQLETATEARVASTMADTAESDIIRELGGVLPGGNTVEGKSIVGRYLSYGDERSADAMRRVVANRDPAKAADDLLNFVGNDKAAVEGARKAFWQVLEQDAKTGGKTIATDASWSGNALAKFTSDPAKMAVAERLYRDNPEHLARIKDIAETLKGVDTRNTAKAPNTSGSAQGLQSNVPIETIQSSVFAVERGVVSPIYAVTRVAGVWARRATSNQQVKAFNMALDRALLDPDWAAKLLEQNNPANRAALQRSAKAWMGNQASTLIDMLDEDPDKELKNRVMEK